MAIALPSRRWTAKPPRHRFDINWSSPLADGLVFFPWLGEGVPVDLANGIAGDDSGPAARVATKEGDALYIDGADILFANVPHGIEQGAFSIAASWRWDGTTQNWQSIISINDDATFYLPRNQSQNYGSMDTRAGNARNWTTMAVNSGEIASYGYSIEGTTTTPIGYKDGISVGNASGTSIWNTFGTTSDVEVGKGQGTEYCHGALPYVALWNRVLTARDYEALHRNVWGELARSSKRYFFIPSTGAGPAPTGSANDEYYKTLLSGTGF